MAATVSAAMVVSAVVPAPGITVPVPVAIINRRWTGNHDAWQADWRGNDHRRTDLRANHNWRTIRCRMADDNPGQGKRETDSHINPGLGNRHTTHQNGCC